MPSLRELKAAIARPSMQIALIVACAQFMQNLDGTIIVTALPAMAQSFATTASRMSEGITAYALAAAVCIPASAWLADRMGTRNLFCTAIALFTVSSMACGIAGSFFGFIVWRLLQGGDDGAGRAHDRAAQYREARAHADAVGSRVAGTARAGNRAAARRLHHERRLVALDFLYQPAVRHRGARSRAHGDSQPQERGADPIRRARVPAAGVRGRLSHLRLRCRGRTADR